MRICRESLLTTAHGLSCSKRKGATVPFSCLPARTGSGRARKWVKGLVPCGFLGQSPKPSERYQTNICNYQGSIEPFLLAQFFHNLLDTTFASLKAQTSYEKMLCLSSLCLIIFIWDSNILQSTEGGVANLFSTPYNYMCRHPYKHKQVGL